VLDSATGVGVGSDSLRFMPTDAESFQLEAALRREAARAGVLLRSLPNPLSPAETARIRDARPAGPAPVPAAEPIRVQRRVSSRGALVVAGQRIHVGIGHAGCTLDVEPADRTIRVYDHTGALLAEVPCTTTKSIARFKVRRPEPP
jgi:hypothetical protein